MAGFRNVLVHGYTDVDLAIVEDVLRERHSDLDRFVAEGWIERQEGALRLTDAGFLLCDAITVALIT